MLLFMKDGSCFPTLVDKLKDGFIIRQIENGLEMYLHLKGPYAFKVGQKMS